MTFFALTEDWNFGIRIPGVRSSGSNLITGRQTASVARQCSAWSPAAESTGKQTSRCFESLRSCSFYYSLSLDASRAFAALFLISALREIYYVCLWWTEICLLLSAKQWNKCIRTISVDSWRVLYWSLIPPMHIRTEKRKRKK